VEPASPVNGQDLPAIAPADITTTEAHPAPAPGPDREALVLASRARIDAAQATMTGALDGYLSRLDGVVTSRVRGPRVRKGTRWWGENAKSLHTPISLGGVTGLETKAVDTGYALPDKLVAEAADVARPIAQRIAHDAALATARSLSVRVPGDPADISFAVDHVALEQAVDRAVSRVQAVADHHATLIRDAIGHADAHAETLDELLGQVQAAHAQGAAWVRMAGRAVTNGLIQDVSTGQARALGVTHAQWLCVAADTRVWAPGAINVAQRWSDEGLLRIATARTVGTRNILSVTPDHPLLTQRGWISAREIHPGDRLVRSAFAQRESGGNPHIENLPAKISETFRAAAQLRPTERIMRVAPYFDSDRRGSYVDVVPIDSELRDCLQSAFHEPRAQLLLTLSDLDLEGLLELRSFRHHGIRLASSNVESRQKNVAPSSNVDSLMSDTVETSGRVAPPGDATLRYDELDHFEGSVEFDRQCSRGTPRDVSGDDAFLVQYATVPAQRLRGPGLLGSFGVSREADTNGLLGGSQDTNVAQPSPDGFRADSLQSFRDLAGRFSDLVTLDQVVDVEFDPTPCHVYDLQTETGWFVADGYVVHNSRRDEHVRPTHVRADGQVRELGAPFRVGTVDLAYPCDPAGLPDTWPEVAGCRCGLLFRAPAADHARALGTLSTTRPSRAGPGALALLAAVAAGGIAVHEVAAPLGVAGGPDGAPPPSRQVVTHQSVVGYRALEQELAVTPGQWLRLPGPIVLGLSAPSLFAEGAPVLSVLIPAGVTLTVAGGLAVLAAGTALEVLSNGPTGVQVQVAAPQASYSKPTRNLAATDAITAPAT
jgi:hypothetical protein